MQTVVIGGSTGAGASGRGSTATVHNATLLQRLVVASADLRVVIIGRNAWVWRRLRSAKTIDWRAEDPSGTAIR